MLQRQTVKAAKMVAAPSDRVVPATLAKIQVDQSLADPTGSPKPPRFPADVYFREMVSRFARGLSLLG